MKKSWTFKDQKPISSTFKALKLDSRNSRVFKGFQDMYEPSIILRATLTWQVLPKFIVKARSCLPCTSVPQCQKLILISVALSKKGHCYPLPLDGIHVYWITCSRVQVCRYPRRCPSGERMAEISLHLTQEPWFQARI